MDNLEGSVLKSYEVLERLDSGGFGAVYRAFQPVIERDVVVKVILPMHANRPEFIRRFEIEAQLVARLEHPHIVPLYDYWRDPDGAYLVMRWLRGGNLRRLLDRGPLNLGTATRLMDQIAGALSVAHRHNVVHHDLKPENILLDEDGNFYLTDFGIAEQVGGDSQSGMVAGSASYISPEQIESRPPDTASDIYSLGVLLYEILVGQHPFGQSSVSELIYKQMTEPLPFLMETAPHLPETLDVVLQRATEKQASMRYPTTLAFADAFREAVGMQRSTLESTRIIASALTTNPYKGLRAFDEADAGDFFGREALISRLVQHLQRANERFLAVVGPSGSGKSSVVRAGLIPQLRSATITDFDQWFIADMVPGYDPIKSLHAALLSIAADPPENLLERLETEEDGLSWAADRLVPENTGYFLLFVDQFEELFTMTADEQLRQQFLTLIYQAVRSEKGRLFVVVSIRADFFDRPLLYTGIGNLVQQNTQVVLPLSADELERAITGPARRVGLQIDNEVVAAIIADVRQEPGALPLLQYALTELFEQRSGDRITLSSYDKLGGVQGALARRADDVYESLIAELEPIAREIFLRLVTLGEGTEDTRRRVQRQELYSLYDRREGVDAVLEMFGQSRLLTFDFDTTTREPIVEIAHEAIIRTWPMLRQWLDESRDDIRLQRALSIAARDWESREHDAGYLLRSGRLIQFEEWAEATTISLSEQEQAFLEASIEEHEKALALEQERKEREAALEQRSRRYLQLAAVAFGVFGIVAVFLAGLAFRARQVAQDERDNAQVLRDEAVGARATSDANAANAQRQLLIAERRAAEIQNLNRLNAAEQALIQGDSGLAMRLILTVADSDVLPSNVQNNLYNVAYGSMMRRQLFGHERKITAIAVDSSGMYLATGSEDLHVLLWDYASGEIVATLTGHQGPINGLVFSPDGSTLVSVATDGRGIVWDVATQTMRFELLGHTNVLTDVAFSSDGRWIATSSGDKTVIVWDAATGSQKLRFTGHDESVRTVAFNPNGQMVLSADRSGVILNWVLESGYVLDRLEGHTASVEKIVISPNGQFALSASADRTLVFWDLITRTIIRRFEGHSEVIADVAYSPDGLTAVSTSCAQREVTRACTEGEVIVWDLRTGLELRRLVGHQDTVNVVSYSSDGREVITGSCSERQQAACTSGELKIWDATPATDIQYRLAGHTSSVLSAAISSDGVFALSGGGTRLEGDRPRGDNGIILWRLADGEAVRRYEGHQADVSGLVFSPDRQSFFSASHDGTVLHWDRESGEIIHRYEGHEDQVLSIALSPDGRQLLSAGPDRVILWDVLSNREARSIQDLGRDITVTDVAFSRDGTRFVGGLNNGVVVLWNSFGNEVRRFFGHTDDILDVKFSPDGRLLLSASEDTTIRLWDISTGELLNTYIGHRGAVTGIAFMPQGSQFISSSTDGSVLLWQVDSTEIVREFEGHADAVNAIALSQSGELAITVSGDGYVNIWRVSLDALVHWIEGNRYIRQFTEAERLEFGIEVGN